MGRNASTFLRNLFFFLPFVKLLTGCTNGAGVALSDGFVMLWRVMEYSCEGIMSSANQTVFFYGILEARKEHLWFFNSLEIKGFKGLSNLVKKYSSPAWCIWTEWTYGWTSIFRVRPEDAVLYEGGQIGKVLTFIGGSLDPDAPTLFLIEMLILEKFAGFMERKLSRQLLNFSQ